MGRAQKESGVRDLAHVQHHLFKRFLTPVSVRWRERRMRWFMENLGVLPNQRVLDIGGQAIAWAGVQIPLEITIMNLPGAIDLANVPQHEFHYLEGDACTLSARELTDFDVVYSNSVIEHVGDQDRQRAFADSILSLNTNFWIQTPSKWFPIEAHCGMPFWWFYPDSTRQYFIKRWEERLPLWAAMVEQTRVLERSFLRDLFPEARLMVERVGGFPKSYIVWNNKRKPPRA